MITKISIKNKISREQLLNEYRKSYNHYSICRFTVSWINSAKDNAVFIHSKNHLVCVYVINKRRIRIIYFLPYTSGNITYLEYNPLEFFDVIIDYLRIRSKWEDHHINELIWNTIRT